MSNDLKSLARKRVPLLAGWLVFWVLFGLVEGFGSYGELHLEGRAVGLGLVLWRGMEACLIWAVLGLGVLWLAQRYPFERAQRGRWALVHIAGCVATLFLFSATYAALLRGHPSLQDGSPHTFAGAFKKLFLFSSITHAIMYWFIVLLHQAWYYYGRYREREKAEAELQVQLSRARLDALRMQLNPHFLFNSLNTITALIHEQPEAADRMVTQLSELLRVSLERTDTQEVPLRQELAFLERYLAIEQTRFGDRLRVEVRADDSLADALVPALILQPLVENAIHHGVENRESGALIRLEAGRDGDWVELRVSDNGPGLPDGGVAPHREGIGLSNTRSRLQHLYGSRQSLSLTPSPAGGLEARIRIPFRAPATAAAPLRSDV